MPRTRRPSPFELEAGLSATREDQLRLAKALRMRELEKKRRHNESCRLKGKCRVRHRKVRLAEECRLRREDTRQQALGLQQEGEASEASDQLEKAGLAEEYHLREKATRGQALKL